MANKLSATSGSWTERFKDGAKNAGIGVLIVLGGIYLLPYGWELATSSWGAGEAITASTHGAALNALGPEIITPPLDPAIIGNIEAARGAITGIPA